MITVQELRDICEGLHLPETTEQIFKRVKAEGGIRGAARYYGSSFASYSCHQLAGRLGYIDLLTNVGGGSNLEAYIRRIKPLLRPEIVGYIQDNQDHFQALVDKAEKRFSQNFDWLMFMSHETSYLLRDSFEGPIIETPAQMHLRVVAELFYPMGDEACGTDDLAEAILCYELSTLQYFTFASPVMFNSGHPSPNLCSCFLMSADDSLTDIMGAMYKAALVSKAMGGVGMNISHVRHSGIGSRGKSRGVMPMLQVYDRLIRYVDQTGKRNGASTVFIQAHHIDLMDVIRSTLKNANDKDRLDSLNTAVMFPDIFWERLREDGPWTLFCPKIFPGLNESFGDTYRELYLRYESMPLNKRDEEFRIRTTARKVADTLADSQIMSGMPYVLHKDSINACSNQVNMNSKNPLHHRVIEASNLCLEIMEQVDSEEVACCNLGQMSLKAFIVPGTKDFDFNKFGFAVRAMVKFLDRIIDRNKYVFPEAKLSNLRHRPIGLGVSGYADMLDILGIAYESREASELNRKIFACMYYNALVSSMELALKNGGPYSTFDGSPLSEGKFAFDLWRARKEVLEPIAIEPTPVDPKEWGQQDLYIEALDLILPPSWSDLRDLIVVNGVRNSQMLAIMPSASTSRLMGNAENTEAHQSNLYIRNFMKASAVVINPQLFGELDGKLGLWSRDVAEFIVSQEGSIARLPEFLTSTAGSELEKGHVASLTGELTSLCSRFKTMFEIKQLKVVQQVADRHRYICQGISYNVYLSKPSRAMLRNLHMATHKAGLKTGMYYLREPVPSEAPEYARTSSRVRTFLTGRVMPPISSHEPFPHPAPVVVLDDEPETKIQVDEPQPLPRAPDTEATNKFLELLAREEVEVVGPTQDRGEGKTVCRRQAGCMSCE